MNNRFALTIVGFVLVLISCRPEKKIYGKWICIHPEDVQEIEILDPQVVIRIRDEYVTTQTLEGNHLKFQLIRDGKLQTFDLGAEKKSDRLTLLRRIAPDNTTDTLEFVRRNSIPKQNVSGDDICNILTSQSWATQEEAGIVYSYFLSNRKLVRCNSTGSRECFVFDWKIVDLDSIFFLTTHRFSRYTSYIEEINDVVRLVDLESGEELILTSTNVGQIETDKLKLRLEGDWEFQGNAPVEIGYFKQISFHSDGNFMPFSAELNNGEVVMGRWSLSHDGIMIFLGDLKNSNHNFFRIQDVDENILNLVYRSELCTYSKMPL